MPYTTLITAGDLATQYRDPNWAVVDCRFTLAEPERGWTDYINGHIAGAVYAHINRDLSDRHIPGSTGRHPLPPVKTLAATFSTWGIDERAQVVAYDDSGGSMAARLWWLLQWLGHDAVAVLDGGWQAWVEAGGRQTVGMDSRSKRRFTPHERPELIWDAAVVERARMEPHLLVADSRTEERYRGENETIDPVAGHIPGAISVPYAGNLDDDGHFRSKEELAARFKAAFGRLPPEQVAFYCGSGVTAAHNVLAVAHAGLGKARLYPGSWSEWIAARDRPVAVGPK